MFALFIFIAILIGIALIYGFAGFMFAVVCNFLMPVFWHAAPHLSWLHGVAASWLLGVVQGVLGGFAGLAKKSD